jgi:hypothetical protein
MWVAAGAKYLPDPPRPAKLLRELEDNGIPAPGMERRGREVKRAERGGKGRGRKGGEGGRGGANSRPQNKVMGQRRLSAALHHPYTIRPDKCT